MGWVHILLGAYVPVSTYLKYARDWNLWKRLLEEHRNLSIIDESTTLIAAVLSAASYGLIIIGGTLSLIGSVAGYIALAAGIALAGLMYWVIDPKLRAVSSDYEEKQKAHLARLESITRWEKQ